MYGQRFYLVGVLAVTYALVVMMAMMMMMNAGARGAHDARRDGVHATAAIHVRYAGRYRGSGELVMRGGERPGACTFAKVRK